MNRLLIAGAACAALLASTAAHAAAFPGIGADTLGPEFMITIAGGTATIGPASGQGSFDGIEDTYIGVVNNSNSSVGFIDLTGTSIFGFDGDGLCHYNAGANCSTVNTFSQNGGYAGGNTVGFVDSFFSNIVCCNSGRLNFSGGLAPGQQAFFSLEEKLSGANVQITGVGGIPEPATWAMMLMGFFGMGALVRRQRSATATA